LNDRADDLKFNLSDIKIYEDKDIFESPQSQCSAHEKAAF